MSAPRKILIRGVNWLGDAVMSMPAVQRLKEALPAAEITMLAPEKLADLWRLHPCVSDVIAITSEEHVWQVGRRLRWGNFEAALVFPNSPRSAIEVWLGRIPRRIGYARPWRNFLLTETIPTRSGEMKMRKRSAAEIDRLISAPEKGKGRASIPESAHHVHQYLHLAGAAFGAKTEPIPPCLNIGEADVRKFKQHFSFEESERPLFGLNPGAEYGAAKRWPKERFILAASELTRKTQCRWLIFGGKADAPLAAEIATEIQASFPGEDLVHNLAGQTSLRELCVALKLCRVLVTNDTGPMHVAAAVGTPVVVAFGSTSPEMTAPISSSELQHQLIKAEVPCSPCFLRECPIDFRCMKGISVEQIVDATLRMLPGKP